MNQSDDNFFPSSLQSPFNQDVELLETNSEELSQTIASLLIENSELRNKRTQNEANLEAITTALDSNAIVTSEMIEQLESENEKLREMLQRRSVLAEEIDKINEIKTQFSFNDQNYQDFVNNCEQLKQRLDHVRKIYDSDVITEDFDIHDLELKLSFLKQKNLIQQTQISERIDQLLKKKKEIMFKLQERNSLM